MLENVRQRDARSRRTLDVSGPKGSDETQIDFREILRLLSRRKWTVLATVVVVLGLATFVTFQLDKKYTATTLLVVDSRDSQLLGFQPGTGDPYANNSAVDTEVEIVKS